MSILDGKEWKEVVIDEQEEDRLSKISHIPCMGCNGIMTVGAEEAMGICSRCYLELSKDME